MIFIDLLFYSKISISILKKKVKTVYNTQMLGIDYSPFYEESINQICQFFKDKERLAEFHLWFNINYEESELNKIIVSVPSPYMKDQIQIRGYKKMIEDKLLEISGQNIEIEMIIKQKTNQNTINNQTIKNDNNPINFSKKKKTKKKSYNSNDSNNIKEKNTNQNLFKKEIEKKKEPHPDLNPMYTFENFVNGDENEYVYNAAITASKNPGTSCNPLLIYGGVGLGKTHLMKAIGYEIYKNTNLNVIFITAEDFTNEFIESLKTKKQNQFKMKYRKADVLLIDDIHFFQDKEGTQEELFHTFNALYENGKQLVFTCDRPVSELKNMTDRLKSRFQRGINADIHMPKYEIRVAIINKKLQEQRKNLSSDIIDLIAKNIQTNVRDLEACLRTIVEYPELAKKPLTIDIAKNILMNTFSQNTSITSIESIQKVVADYFRISVSSLKSKTRSQNIAGPRHYALYLARELTEYSTTELGKEFGGRDHSTVMHSIQKIEDIIKTDSTVQETIHILTKKIKEFKNE